MQSAGKRHAGKGGMQDRHFFLGSTYSLGMEPYHHAKGSPKPRILGSTPHTSGTPIFRQASKKLSTFFRDLRVLSFGWGV